jgi:hypothetical protein
LSQHHAMRTDQGQSSLVEAARSRTPAVLTYQTSSGWAMVKTQFLDAGDANESLCLELAVQPGRLEEPMPEIGQELGVSFRRGSRKCVFTACLTACETQPTPGGRTRTLLRVTWPDAIQELQRRLYHRTPIPSGRFIPVDLWLARARETPQAAPLAHRGRMLDLSAGGLSVEFPLESRPRWQEDDQLACRFAASAGRAIEVTARVTNYERRSDGRVRVGLQFMGLDAGDRGRQVLQQISGLTQQLQRSGSDRR